MAGGLSSRRLQKGTVAQIRAKAKLSPARKGSPSVKITMPEKIMEQLGAKAGDVIEFVAEVYPDGVIVTVEKAKPEDDGKKN